MQKKENIEGNSGGMSMEYYTGFFIEEKNGNNLFSYEGRSNKKIYVPPLKEGKMEDVKIGTNIVFSEIEENKEINALGLEYFIKYKDKRKDVFIFDNHNHAFYFWAKALNEGKLKKGIKLVHVDQHKDMREPEKYMEEVKEMKKVFEYTNYTLNVGNFIKPALYSGIFSEVIIIDNSKGFNLKIQEEYALDIDLDIFSRDMDYIDYDLKIYKIKEWIKKAAMVTVATSPFFIEQEYAIKVLKELFEGE